ncbi:MAG: DMT family transporter [Gammaproteobacteria bacterium]|nr:DMT family transporter [Gammaproteobacteria bacterium]
MTLSTIILVLAAAFLHAAWNAFIKAGDDKLLSLALMHGCSGIICLCLLPFVPIPSPAAWPYLGLSLVLHWGYYGFLISGYRVGDLGLVYPLARGSAPLLIAGFGVLLAGETLSLAVLAGIALACVGIISLSFENGLPWRGNLKPVLFALGTAIWISGYTLADGLGVREAQSKLGYIIWLFVLEAATFGTFVSLIRRHTFKDYYLTHWRGLWTSGMVAALAYGLVIYAMSTNTMAMISALRETSVIIAVLIGGLMLKERHMLHRVCAAVTVVVGITIMNLAP